MKNTIITLLMLCLITLTASAQKAELLKARWRYKDIADKEKIDSMTLKQAQMVFFKMEMEFAADGKFSYNPLGDNPYSLMNGTWLLNSEQTKVSVKLSKPSTPENEKTTEWTIMGLTANELKLDMGKAVIIFNRVLSAAEIKEKQLKELVKKQKKFSEGLAAVELNGKWGFIDATGKEIIPFKYDYADNFSGGLAMVRVGKYPNYSYGFVDKTGTEVVPLIYNSVGKLSEELIPVNQNDNWGYIDRTGRVVIPLKYGGTWNFIEGLAMVRNGKFGVGKCGFIDKTGAEVIPLKYDMGDEGFKEGLALVVLARQYGFIDKTGKEVVPPKYDFAFSFAGGFAVVTQNKKWGFIDKTGKEIIPLKYDNAGINGFANGPLLVKLNDKWGFIDKTGKEIIALKYEDADEFKDGKAKVKLNGREFYIDKTGKEVK